MLYLLFDKVQHACNLTILITANAPQQAVNYEFDITSCKFLKNLESMAKQLYDYWFVQFDFPDEKGKPYKTSGGEMVYNERLKRMIPKGWNCYSIQELCDINKKTISKKDYKQIEYLDTGSITQGCIYNTEHYDIEDAPSRAQRKVEDMSIVYSSVRPRLLHFGILSRPKENFIVSTGFITLDAKNKQQALMLYYFLTSETIVQYLGSVADTAVSSYPSIGPDEIAFLDVVYPCKSIIQMFNNVVEPMFRKISDLRDEISTLTKQRDELLPLLMNGQATVNYHLYAFIRAENHTECQPILKKCQYWQKFFKTRVNMILLAASVN